MKKFIIILTGLILTGCLDKVDVKYIRAWEEKCINNGGAVYIRVGDGGVIYYVSCKDGAIFESLNSKPSNQTG